MGCYALGAHQQSRTLRARFSFPDTARERYAEQIALVERETGWRVELHPAPHQGHLAEAALGALPAGIEPQGAPSLRAQDRTVTVRALGTAAEGQIEGARRLFREQTGWELAVEGV
jgi:hypothetical protein